MNWASKETKDQLDEFEQAAKVIRKLGIKFTPINLYGQQCIDNTAIDGNISLLDLYDLFNDEEKFKELAEKIRLRSFW